MDAKRVQAAQQRGAAGHGPALTPGMLLRLQRTAGNAAVSSLVSLYQVQRQPADGGPPAAGTEPPAAATGPTATVPASPAPPAPAPPQTPAGAGPGVQPREEATGPPLDLASVAAAAPQLGPAVAALQQQQAAFSAEVEAAGQARKLAITAAADQQRDAVGRAAAGVPDSIRAAFAASSGELTSTIAARRATLQAALREHQAAAAAAASGEADRLGTESAALQEQVRGVAGEKSAAARQLGEDQAARATGRVAEQAASARQKGEQKVTTYQAETNADKRTAMQKAVRELAGQQATEIERTGPELASSARRQSAKMVEGFSEQADKVVSGIAKAAPDTVKAVRGLGGAANEQMAKGLEQALKGLADLEAEGRKQLAKLQDTALAQSKQLGEELRSQVGVVERAAHDQVDATVEESHGLFEQAAVATLMRSRGGPVAGTDLAGAREQALQVLAQLGDKAIEELGTLGGRAADAAGDLERQLAGGFAGAVKAVGRGADQISDKTSEGFRLAATEVGKKAKELADSTLGTFRGQVSRASAEINASFDKQRGVVEQGITDGLARNDAALSELDGRMTEAASKAAAEVDRPGWQKFLLALGKAVLTIVAAIVITVVLAVVIYLVALVVVTGGIAFGTALIIAAVLLALYAVVSDMKSRIDAYIAEHGPIDSFWKALGVGFLITIISIGSLTGITQIIEGIMGHRFLSDIPLSEQERYDLVVGGFLQLILFGLGVRSLSKGGGARPGFLGRLVEGIGKWLDGITGRGNPPVEVPVDPNKPAVDPNQPDPNQPPVVLKADPYERLGTKFKLTPDQVELMRASGVDPALLDRLLARGVDGDTVALVASRHGILGVRTLDALTSRGVDTATATDVIERAAAAKVLDVVEELSDEGIISSLLKRGFSTDEIVKLSAELGKPGMHTIDGLMEQGVEKGPAIDAARLAKSIGAAGEVRQLVDSKNLQNPRGLRNFLQEVEDELIAGQEGKLRALQEAARRSASGPVALEKSLTPEGKGDVIDIGGKEVLQMKVVTSEKPGAVARNIEAANRQLVTEKPPDGFTKVIDVRIEPPTDATRPSNPMIGMDRGTLLQALKDDGVSAASVSNADKIRVSNGNATSPNEFTRGDF